MRSMLRACRGITDYNVRSYAYRRTIEGFRENAGATGADADALLARGREDLAMLRRQAVISEMYNIGSTVMEGGR
jgi:hypothetical protein